MYILIVELNDDGLPHGVAHFGPYIDDAPEVVTAEVHAWGRAHGYFPDKGEVVVSCEDVTETDLHDLHLHDVGERSVPGRFNAVAADKTLC